MGCMCTFAEILVIKGICRSACTGFLGQTSHFKSYAEFVVLHCPIRIETRFGKVCYLGSKLWDLSRGSFLREQNCLQVIVWRRMRQNLGIGMNQRWLPQIYEVFMVLIRWNFDRLANQQMSVFLSVYEIYIVSLQDNCSEVLLTQASQRESL